MRQLQRLLKFHALRSKLSPRRPMVVGGSFLCPHSTGASPLPRFANATVRHETSISGAPHLQSSDRVTESSCKDRERCDHSDATRLRSPPSAANLSPLRVFPRCVSPRCGFPRCVFPRRASCFPPPIGAAFRPQRCFSPMPSSGRFDQVFREESSFTWRKISRRGSHHR